MGFPRSLDMRKMTAFANKIVLAVRSISPRPVRPVGHCRHLCQPHAVRMSALAVRISRALKCLIYRKIFGRADIVSLRQQCAFSRASSAGHDVRGVDVTGGVLGASCGRGSPTFFSVCRTATSDGWPISSVKLRPVCQSVWNSVQRELTMPQFDPELVRCEPFLRTP